MTTHDRDKVIAAAKEAGITYSGTMPEIFDSQDMLAKFYAIAYEAGRQAEKDACIEDVKIWWAHGSESVINTIHARSTK